MMMHRVHPTAEIYDTAEWEIVTPDAGSDMAPLSMRWLVVAALVTVLLLSLAILL